MAQPQTLQLARRSRRKRKLTEEEFLRLPDDGRKYELVDGEAKEVPTGGRHGAIGIRLGSLLMSYAQGRGILYDSSTGFRMVTGNIRSPDVAFMFKERLPEGKSPIGFIEGAPDLAIEILSPKEDMDDLLRKIGEYFASGAKQVWLLFPDQIRVNLYTSPFDAQILFGEDELTGGDLLPGFRCKVKELFEVE